MEIFRLTIEEALDKMDRQEISSVELTESFLKRIKEIDTGINACLTVCEESAIDAAKSADTSRKKGEQGSLLGIPMLVKDNIMTSGIRTTAASRILENYISPYDATIVARLKKSGSIILGKTNLDEFAHGASTENSAFGPTHNPWDISMVPGGSSGGSGAAVAADMSVFALGTDTGGSIRCPAAFCGVVGLKPTYGRCSRFGLIAMTSSTDVPGTLSKTVMDAAILLKEMAGLDERDSTTVDTAVPDYPAMIRKDIKGLTVGLPEEYFGEGTDKEVRDAIEKAIEKLSELGAVFKKVKLPHTKYGVGVYYIITPSEISSNLARFDGIKYGFSETGENSSKDSNLLGIYKKSRGKGFGPEAIRRIMLGTYALSAGYYDAYYLQAQKVRTIIKNEIDNVLQDVDCLLTPTSPHTAFKIGEQVNDHLKMYLEDIFVTGASLAGLPAISIPCGFSQGLPIGLQIIGKRFDEETILRTAYNYEQATEWHQREPNI
jgi:aspartyl-tRNA(Asn)/glutamyl-tRNA(Gln) amidotransferase subunit A